MTDSERPTDEEVGRVLDLITEALNIAPVFVVIAVLQRCVTHSLENADQSMNPEDVMRMAAGCVDLDRAVHNLQGIVVRCVPRQRNSEGAAIP